MNSEYQMGLHRLAADNRSRQLAAALKESPGNVDDYRPASDLEDVIIRHGLKGTPLHVAVVNGSVDCVRVLLQYGADPEKCVIQSERGDQEIPYADALFLAEKTGRSEIAAMLKRK